MSPIPDPGRRSSPGLVVPLVILAGLALGLALRPGLLADTAPADFLLVSLFLGGGAAWLTGRAVARSWAPLSRLVIYCLLLAAAVRFGHFALFEDALFAPLTSMVEALFLFAVAALGYRHVRKHQMIVQYGWLFAAAGPFGWRRVRPHEDQHG